MPLQKPHPPIWIPGVASTESVVWAAKHKYPYVALAPPVDLLKGIYELYDETAKADAANHVPQGILDIEGQPERPVMKRAVAKDQPILMDDVDIPSNRMTDLWEQQKPLVGLG